MKLDYDAISPFTGNKSVLIEPDLISGHAIATCMDTGYYTYNVWKDGSEFVERFEETCPQIVKDTKFIDSDGLVWYKTVGMCPSCALYPALGEDEILWKVSKLRDVLVGEEPESNLTLIIPIDEQQAVTKILDENTTVTFKELEFKDAMDYFFKIGNE